MRSKIGLLVVFTIIFIIPTLNYAFAAGDEPGEYLDRRVVIWNLFFRMMVVAFTIGAVVAGTMVWLVWRFRESNPNVKPTKYEETGDW